MNFYLDFEAARFTNRIISIGCVTDKGASFKTLVSPGKKKIDGFITDLTGITNDMLRGVPNADTAFLQLYNFIIKNSDNRPPAYYVYGNSDVEFLRATLKYMSNPISCVCVQAIMGNLIDYAEDVKRFFVAKNDLALRKVYMLIQDEKNLIQKHDALEDALMLETVVAHLHDRCKPEDKETIMAMPSQPRPQTKKAPAIFQKWNASPKWEADTEADAEHWMIKCVDQHSGEVKYFNDFNVAALWVVKYIARNVSPKNGEAVKKIAKTIASAPESGKCRYNCYWEYSPEGAIAAAAKETA